MIIYVQDQARVVRAKRLLYSAEDEKIPDTLEPLELEEALRREWPTDAHFLCYSVVGEREISPLAKPMLSILRAAGSDVLTSYLAVDLDTNPHEPWTGIEKLEAAEVELSAALENSDIPLPAVYYPTLKGMRLIYILAEDVPAEKSEPIHRGLLSLFKALDLKLLKVDSGTSDWTRCFRLPDVVRGEERTPEWIRKRLDIDLTRKVHPSDLPELGPESRATRPRIDLQGRPMPDLETARDILFDGKAMTDLHKEMKKRLKNRDCFEYIWPDTPQALRDLLPPHGERDTIMTRIVGQTVSLAYHVRGTRPEHVFAMLLDWVSLMPPEEAQQDPIGNLWGKILRFWEAESERELVREEEEERIEVAKEVERLKKEASAESILGAARALWPPGTLPEGDDEAMLLLRRRAVLDKSGKYFVLQSDGTYSRLPCTNIVSLYAHVRQAGIDGVLVQTKGEDRLVPVNNFLKEHCTSVGEISYHSGGYKVGSGGGVPTTEGGLTYPIMRLRGGLEPTYDEEIHKWLTHFVGADRVDALCNWIAWSFDLHSPICGLALIGAPAAGKKLFVQGLAECFDPSIVATNSIFGTYAAALRRTVIVSLDEGIAPPRGGLHPSERFRSLVAGDPNEINEKFMPPFVVRAPARVIITSNTLDILQGLAKPGMTEHDRRALLTRILVFDVLQDASDYLANLGGFRYTGKPGRRWISSDGGHDSDFLIARHFLWIRDNFKRWPVGSRFLVDGAGEGTELSDRLRSDTTVEASLIQALLHYVETSAAQRTVEASYAEVDGEIYCTKVFAKYLLPPNTPHKLSATALETIAKPGRPGGRAFRLNGHLQRWFRIDKELLWRVAEREGYPRDRFSKIINARSKGWLPSETEQ